MPPNGIVPQLGLGRTPALFLEPYKNLLDKPIPIAYSSKELTRRFTHIRRLLAGVFLFWQVAMVLRATHYVYL
jgi:hypothetical protein